jgi:alpha-methylacyl-CoA racemase
MIDRQFPHALPINHPVVRSPAVQPLAGMLVVDLTRYLPGAFASRELLRLGARVVRLEPPEGDPMRHVAPAWDEALNGGKESVACDLKAEPELARALLERADIALEGFRPGVAARLGVGPDSVPESVVYCSITGFGAEGPHAARAGHDLNYLGWAGVLEDTAPGLPPVQPADLAAGALGAVVEVLAAVLERQRTGRGARLTISMTHGSHRLVSHRLGGDPLPRFLTGGLACYRIYKTSDGRLLTVGALEPKFFLRLCEVIGRPELAERHLEPDGQEELAAELAASFAARSLDEWLQLFDGEDVCVGPVATLADAAEAFGSGTRLPSAPVGQHTAAWRAELGFS